MTDKKALDCAKIIVAYCEEQKCCQNCIFRKHGGDHWDCFIKVFDMREVVSNFEAKKKNHGYI